MECLFVLSFSDHPFILMIGYARKICKYVVCVLLRSCICVISKLFHQIAWYICQLKYKYGEKIYRSNYMILPSITWQLLLEYHYNVKNRANDTLKENWSHKCLKLSQNFVSTLSLSYEYPFSNRLSCKEVFSISLFIYIWLVYRDLKKANKI